MMLLNQLSALESAGLVQVAKVVPELEYSFRHALVMDAAYASLLTSDRRRLHLAVAEIVEQLYPDRLEEYAPVLGQHFERAGDNARAFKYYLIAANDALRSYANQEAESHFRSALTLSTEDAGQPDLFSGLGEAVYRQSRFEEAIRIWFEGIHLYQGAGNLDGVARLYARAARSAWHSGDYLEGLRLCEEGLAAVAGAPESSNLALLTHEAARAYHFNGRQDEAMRFCQRALAMAEQLGALDVQADALATLGVLGNQPAEAGVEALEKAVAIAEGHGLLEIAARAYHNLGVMTGEASGDQQTARQYYLKGAELARRLGIAEQELFSLFSVAGISLGLGEVDVVQQMLPELEKLQKTIADPGGTSVEMLTLRASLERTLGNLEGSLDILQTAEDEARPRGNLQTLLYTLTDFAGIMLQLDHQEKISDWSEAEAKLNEAIDISARGVGKIVAPLCLLGAVYCRQGRVREAQ